MLIMYKVNIKVSINLSNLDIFANILRNFSNFYLSLLWFLFIKLIGFKHICVIIFFVFIGFM